MLDLKIIGGSKILVMLVYVLYTEDQKLWLRDDTTEQINNQTNF